MDASPRRLGLTLSGLYFLAYFPPGAIFTAGFTFMARPLAWGGLGFTPGQVAAVAAAGALGSLAAIGLVHRLRDFSCRRALAILFTLAAIVIAFLAAFAGAYTASAASGARGDTSPGAPLGAVTVVAVLLCIYTAANSAASASVATFVQQSISRSGLSYFRLRSAGTCGFVCGGVSLLMVTPVSTQPFWLGCVATLIAAAYTVLALRFFGQYPVVRSEGQAPSSSSHGRRQFPAQQLAFVLILVGSTAILGRLYDAYGNQFLTEIKFPRPCALQPFLAQFPEFLLLLLVPFAALPLKHCLVLGPLSWVCVFLGFFACCQLDNHLVIYLSLPFQAGNCIMQTTASIAVDSMFQTSQFRRTAQAALPFVQGTGLLLGSVINGALVSSATGSAGGTSWNHVWLIASVAAAIATLLASATMAVLPMGRFSERIAAPKPRPRLAHGAPAYWIQTGEIQTNSPSSCSPRT